MGQLHTNDREGEVSRKENKLTHLGDISKEDNVPKGNDGLLIEHVELLGDGCREEATAKDSRAGLGDQTWV